MPDADDDIACPCTITINGERTRCRWQCDHDGDHQCEPDDGPVSLIAWRRNAIADHDAEWHARNCRRDKHCGASQAITVGVRDELRGDGDRAGS